MDGALISGTGGERAAGDGTGGAGASDFCIMECRALLFLDGDRKGVKWAASLDPSDGGCASIDGSLEGKGGSVGRPFGEGVIMNTACLEQGSQFM